MVNPRSEAFAERVRAVIGGLRPGEVVTYGEVAAEAGAPGSARAVGRLLSTEAGDGDKFGVVVDELCGHQQVVIKSIEDSYGQVPGIAAATIFGNGKVALILDVEKLSELSAENMMPANALQAAITTATTH